MPKQPSVPVAPPAAAPPSLANASLSMAAEAQNKKKAVGAVGQGFDDTLVGSPLGEAPKNTAKNSLLGV